MPVLTRKRKAELEAADRKTREQLFLEVENTAEADERPSKHQKRDDPFKRIDPFRPLSPPPKTVLRRRDEVKYSTLKKRPTKSRQPLPIVFFTIPEATPARQVSAKSRSSNDVDIIMATKSIFEHVDKHGTEAMPSREALDSWLEEHKDEFIQARRQRARQQCTTVHRLQAAPRAVEPIGAGPETPAIHHPAARPRINRAIPPVANGGIFRRVVRHACLTLNGFLNQAVTVLDETIPEETVIVPQMNQGHEEHQGQYDHADHVNHMSQTIVGPTQVRPLAPPLDPRFFHPNGQLHSVYKYLTAQIPLPQQWVKWAVANDITVVPGRGDIRELGTYVAEDTFDYDALYQAVHRGHFKTGRIEIDYHLDHWPWVEGRRDDIVADLELREVQTLPDERQSSNRMSEKSDAPSPESLRMLPHGSQGQPGPDLSHSGSTYHPPENVSDTTDHSMTQATVLDPLDGNH